MKTVEFWCWWVVDEVTGKRRATRHKMTEEEALTRCPGATRVEHTLELRQMPETPEESADLFRPRGPLGP